MTYMTYISPKKAVGHTSEFAQDSNNICKCSNTSLQAIPIAGAPSTVAIKSVLPTIEKCNESLKEGLFSAEWSRKEKFKCFSFNDIHMGNCLNLDGLHVERLTIREIKEIIRPYVNSGWYIEMNLHYSSNLFDINKIFHATEAFLNDTAKDQDIIGVQVLFFIENLNKKYIHHLIQTWPLSFLLIPLFIYLSSLSDAPGGKVFILFFGCVLFLISLCVLVQIFIPLKSFKTGKYSTLVDIHSIHNKSDSF